MTPYNADGAMDKWRCRRKISIPVIRMLTVAYYALDQHEFLENSRQRVIARPRQIAMALARELTDASLPRIGKLFGGRHHTTVLHAFRTVSDSAAVAADVSELRRRLAEWARCGLLELTPKLRCVFAPAPAKQQVRKRPRPFERRAGLVEESTQWLAGRRAEWLPASSEKRWEQALALRSALRLRAEKERRARVGGGE